MLDVKGLDETCTLYLLIKCNRDLKVCYDHTWGSHYEFFFQSALEVREITMTWPDEC